MTKQLDDILVLSLGMVNGSLGELMDRAVAFRDDKTQPQELRKQYRYLGRKIEAAMKQIDRANSFIDRAYGDMEIDHHVGGRSKRPTHSK